MQGSDEAALLTLNKLVRDYPNAKPYARQAAEQSVALSRMLEQSSEFLNSADFQTTTDMMLIFQAAHQSNSGAVVKATLRDLRDLVGSMIFELSLPQTNETNPDRPQREKALVGQQNVLRWIEKSEQETDLTKLTMSPLVETKAHTRIEPLDLNTQLYAQRDGFTQALGTGDVARVEQALGSFAATFQPFLGGPPDLGLVEALTGGLKAARAASAFAKEGDFEQALQLWRAARLAFLNSNVAGMGLLIYEINLIPESFRPEFFAAIMYVESAVYDLLEGGRIWAAIRSLQKANQRLKALLEKEIPAEAKARIQRTVQRLTARPGKTNRRLSYCASNYTLANHEASNRKMAALGSAMGLDVHHGGVILAVAIPTAGLLYFMARALNGERHELTLQLHAERQKAIEAASQQAREYLTQKAKVTSVASSKNTSEQKFQVLMDLKQVEGALILDPKGAVAYPILTTPDDGRERSVSETKVDDLIELFDHEVIRNGSPAPLEMLIEHADVLHQTKHRTVRDPFGRLHSPPSILAALQAMPPNHPRRDDFVKRLQKTIPDREKGMPTGQRMFLQ